MSLRKLTRRLDKLEERAKSKRLGILPILTEIDLGVLERWETLTSAERDRYRVDRPDAVSMHSTGPLAAVVATVWLPDEDNLWRLDFEDAEPERVEPQGYESVPPSWEELRNAYVAASRVPD